MTPEEYKAELIRLNREHEERKWELAKRYALANNPYQVGDIIKDHIGALKIEKIKYENGSFGALPCCVYYGIELKKDGTPMKKQENRGVYQSNIEP